MFTGHLYQGASPMKVRLMSLRDNPDQPTSISTRRRAAMLKSVHGALIDAGFSLGDIGVGEADAVRSLAAERDAALQLAARVIILKNLEVSNAREEVGKGTEAGPGKS